MQFTGLVEFPASRIPQYHSLVLVQPLEVAATVSMVLQPLLLALAALTGAVPLVLEEPPRLAHLHHLQERPAPKLLSLGNLAWEVPYLHPLVVASDKVAGVLDLTDRENHVVP